eukprot:7936008-Pyramimonas_sp.AAC.1
MNQRVALAPIPMTPGMHGPGQPWGYFCVAVEAEVNEGMARPGMQELVGPERGVSMSYLTFALAAEALLLNRGVEAADRFASTKRGYKVE